jgi:hypothetical protein
MVTVADELHLTAVTLILDLDWISLSSGQPGTDLS